jgi:hypothetical protein
MLICCSPGSPYRALQRFPFMLRREIVRGICAPKYWIWGRGRFVCLSDDRFSHGCIAVTVCGVWRYVTPGRHPGTCARHLLHSGAMRERIPSCWRVFVFCMLCVRCAVVCCCSVYGDCTQKCLVEKLCNVHVMALLTYLRRIFTARRRSRVPRLAMVGRGNIALRGSCMVINTLHHCLHSPIYVHSDTLLVPIGRNLCHEGTRRDVQCVSCVTHVAARPSLPSPLELDFSEILELSSVGIGNHSPHRLGVPECLASFSCRPSCGHRIRMA